MQGGPRHTGAARVSIQTQEMRTMPGRYEEVCAELVAAPRTRVVTGAAGFIGSHLVEALLGLGQLRRFLARRHKVPGRGARRVGNQWLRANLGLVQLYRRRQVAPSHA